MRFRMLGPLEVQAGEDWTSIGAPKWRAVLARLLLASGQIVPTDTLIHEVWGDVPPARASNMISIYVLRLRRFIGDHDGKLLRTQSPGYQLRTEPGDLDTQRFTTLLRQGQQALSGHDPETASQLLTEAEELWRGDALADVPPSPFVEAEANRLNELRQSATELRLPAGGAAGRDRGAAPELRPPPAAGGGARPPAGGARGGGRPRGRAPGRLRPGPHGPVRPARGGSRPGAARPVRPPAAGRAAERRPPPGRAHHPAARARAGPGVGRGHGSGRPRAGPAPGGGRPGAGRSPLGGIDTGIGPDGAPAEPDPDESHPMQLPAD